MDGWRTSLFSGKSRFVWSRVDGRKEGNVLFNDALKHILFTVIRRQTYGKGPLR